MKVCIIVTNSLRKDPRVQRQLRCAYENGIDVCMLGLKDEFFDQSFLDSLPYYTWFCEIPKNYKGKLNSIFKKLYRVYLTYFPIIKRCIELKPDVIHANDFDTLPGAYIASLFTGAKVVYDSHEIFAENENIYNKRLIKTILIMMESFLVKRVDAFVSVSNASAGYFEKKYRVKKPTVITNCSYSVDIDGDKNKSPVFEVLYHGRITPNRGYEAFAKAASLIKDRDIRFVIRGYGEAEPDVRNIIKEYGLENKVIMDKPVEISQLIEYAARSHVGVVLTEPCCANFIHSVSNKLFEYLQAGIPLILSDIPEHRYLCEKYNFGLLVKDFEKETIFEAVNRLYSDRELYSNLKENAVRASKELCWEKEGLKFINIYKSLSK